MEYSVSLAEVPVAGLLPGTHNRLGLRFEASYRALSQRPILSLSFEDNLRRDYWGPGSGRLPNYLGNLLPEGQLRELIRRQFEIEDENEAALLAAIGHDLPGAATFQKSEGATPSDLSTGVGPESPHPDREEPTNLRFSLAGVQLKFSMLMADRKLHLPARGQDGDWIVKLSFGDFPGLPENEHAMMTWARLIGFEVPETRVLEASAVLGLDSYVDRDFRALAVRRYDRTPGGRVHQEDFAQVLNRPPNAKYDGKAEQMLIIAMKILGYESYVQLLSRLVFSIASGNFDAHLKNWSLFYPDPLQPSLSPLYDQVSTVAWPRVERRMAFSLTGTRSAESLSHDSFGRMAKKLGCGENASAEAVQIAVSTIQKARESWSAVRDLLPSEHRAELVAHWKRTPLLVASGGIH